MNAVAQAVAEEFDAFEMKQAIREASGVLMSVMGPSSSGKTYSLLRVATGIQRVMGGEIAVIDTENRRALHYADRFKFGHIHFGAPYSPDRYLKALEYAVSAGARTILVDSGTHEHTGKGGVLEIHEEELERLSGGDPAKRDNVNFLAWAKPKKMRQDLIDGMLQLNVNILWSYRGKEKIKIERGRKGAKELGWQPVAGEEFIFEMMLQCVLKAGAGGVPTWESDNPYERAGMKLPEQFRRLFCEVDEHGVKWKNRPLDEEVGVKIAEWTCGLDLLMPDYGRCADAVTFEKLEKRRSAAWPKLSAPYKNELKKLSDAAKARIPSGGTGTGTGGKQELDWPKTLREQTALAELNTQWDACCVAMNGKPTQEQESAYQEMRVKLGGDE